MKRPFAIWSLRFALAVATAFVPLTGCHTLPTGQTLHRYEFKHSAMGTLFTITLYAANPTNAQAAAELAFQRVDALEDIMSDYQADSELMRLCDQPFGTAVPVSADLFKVLQLSQRISELSDGAFDITVGPYVRLWRFARKRKVLPTPVKLETARAAVGWRRLQLDQHRHTATLLLPNMRLDLGGIGKGYTADAALAVLKQQGIDRALVAASGDIAIGNAPPGAKGWKVGIAAIGTRTNQVERSILLHNAGISTSGDSEQFIEINGVRYSHILNPATGLGLTNRIQATIIGPNATTTDSLDTTVSILEVQRGLALADSIPRTGALIVTKDDGLTRSYASRRFAKFLPHAESAPEPQVAR